MIDRRKLLAAAAATALLPGDVLAQIAPRKPPPGYGDPYAGKKKLLVVGDTRTGNMTAHLGLSHAMATIEQLGRESGAFQAILRTDTDAITKREVWGKGRYAKDGPGAARGLNLDYFDAVLFYTNGSTDMTPDQKQDLLDFVAKNGKGFVGVHTATVTATDWPEYGEMVGGVFDNHPWMITDARIIVEDPASPFMRGFKTGDVVRDEFYQMLPVPYSRKDVDVLARIDLTSVDPKAPMVHRTDGDFPIAWTKPYGMGRVFYSCLGHPDAIWDDVRAQTMFVEAIKWAVGLTPYTPRPHPLV